VIVVPAIDLLGGRAVRLREGRREEATIYHDRPWEVARELARAGAELLHVVDLDGAFAGERRHAEVIRRIVDEAGVPVQVGGGVRDAAAIAAVLDAGARWVVVGTIAVTSPKVVIAACDQHPDRVIVAVDVRKGQVAIEGWAKESSADAIEVALQAAIWGAAKVLYTDVARDGMKSGPNVEATARLQRLVGPDTPVLASGGIAVLDDLRALAAAGVQQCVVGRALYDGAFTLAEALEAAR